MHGRIYAINSCGEDILFNITTVDGKGDVSTAIGYGGVGEAQPQVYPVYALISSNITSLIANLTFNDIRPWSAAGGLEPKDKHGKFPYSAVTSVICLLLATARPIPTAGLYTRLVYCID